MNDRYLFKALRIGWKNLPKEEQWAQGYFIKKHGIPFIYETSECPMNSLEIYESTLCQCTGLKDKNEALIWENDVINTEIGKAVIGWDCCAWRIKWIQDVIWRKDLWYWAKEEDWSVEVVGNIFDNTELLEEE